MQEDIHMVAVSIGIVEFPLSNVIYQSATLCGLSIWSYRGVRKIARK